MSAVHVSAKMLSMKSASENTVNCIVTCKLHIPCSTYITAPLSTGKD